ncbi:MAG: hypothetical protein ABI380_02365 [Edaphobacter sp.]
MKWIKSIFREIFGLFVDDGSFALAILIWLGLMRWATLRLGISSTATAIILFAGLALILIESTIRYARRKPIATKN